MAQVVNHSVGEGDFIATCSSHNQSTYCPITDWSFADGVAHDIASVLSAYKGGRMVLTGYMPPYEPGEFPDGYLDLTLIFDGLPEACLGITFDRAESTRYGFEYSDWAESGMDPSHSGIVTVTFDEAWRIVCRVGMLLNVKEVAISYGC